MSICLNCQEHPAEDGEEFCAPCNATLAEQEAEDERAARAKARDEEEARREDAADLARELRAEARWSAAPDGDPGPGDAGLARRGA